MLEKWIINLAALATLFISVTAVALVGATIGARQQEQEVVQLCKETGMYLTKGYAISCRVLTNEGYAPKGN